LAGYPQLANIAVLTPEGDVIGSAHPLSGPVNMYDYDAIRRTLQSRDIEVGVYVMGPIVNRPILHLAYAVPSAMGAVQYVVFVAIDLSGLTPDRRWAAHGTHSPDNGSRWPSAGRLCEAVFRRCMSGAYPNSKTRGQRMITARIDGRVQPFAVASMEGLSGVLVASGLPMSPSIERPANFLPHGWLALADAPDCALGDAVRGGRLDPLSARPLTRDVPFRQRRFLRQSADFAERGRLRIWGAFNDMAAVLAVRHRELGKHTTNWTYLRDTCSSRNRRRRIARDLWRPDRY
jgi:hypothetical protein